MTPRKPDFIQSHKYCLGSLLSVVAVYDIAYIANILPYCPLLGLLVLSGRNGTLILYHNLVI
jgi:hypothetical protein